MKPSLPSALVLALSLLPLGAGAQSHCSRETLPVRGTPVTVTYCVAGARAQAAGETSLPVTGTYAARGSSFTRTTTLRFVEGEGPSRTIENVDLAPLGLTGTLHLTLLYSGGTVRVETALLTPGAVVVK